MTLDKHTYAGYIVVHRAFICMSEDCDGLPVHEACLVVGEIRREQPGRLVRLTKALITRFGGYRVKKAWISLIGLFALLVSVSAQGQNTTGTIFGTVTDPSGAAIAGAKVTETNTGTNVVRTVSALANGDYVFNLLPQGTYRVTVSAPGFQSFSTSGIQLSAGDRLLVNAKLPVGKVTQTVSVQANSSALQTASSVVSSTITQSAVQSVPLNGRNFVQLLQVQPGVNQGPPNSLASGTRAVDKRQTASFSADGQPSILNNSMIDGADNNTRGTEDVAIRPALDAIEEISVQTNDYPASVGRTGGAVVNVITKSGTNQFHGDVFEYLRNNITDANAYSFGKTLPKSEMRLNQFGGSLGGPIVKNKAFFFGAYEGYRQRSTSSPTIDTVPTLYEEQHPGDFTDLCPTVGTPCAAGPLLTGSQIDPAGLGYFKMYPAPNTGTNQFYAVPRTIQNVNNFDLRSDYHFNSNNFGFARFIYNQASTELPSGLPDVSLGGKTFDPGAFPVADHATDLDYNAMLSYIHIFTPNLLLHLAANYTRAKNDDVPLADGVNPNAALGQPNVNVQAGDNSGLAPVLVTGGTSLGTAYSSPTEHNENAFQYFGSVNYTHGTHNMQFGASLLRRQVNTVQSSYPEGYWDFTGYPSLVEGSYLSTQRSLDLIPPHYGVWEIGGYAEDNWRATQNLTLNLGLRYDIYTPYAAKNNIISNFDPETGGLLVAGQNGVSDTAGVQTDHQGFEPRLGFAWNPGHELVVRGGYGISYFPDNTAAIADMKNPPFTSTLSTCGVAAGSPVKCPAGMTRFADGLVLPAPTEPTDPTYAISDATDTHFNTAYVQQFNLTVQKALVGNVFTVSYIGLIGQDLIQELTDYNAPPPNTASGAAFQALRPYYSVAPNLQSVQEIESHGSSNYNALQASVDRRFSRGLAFQVNYTFAQNLTNAIAASTATAGGYGTVPSQVNTLDYGNSAIAIRQGLNGTIDYALPFGKSTHGLEAGAIKGWQMSVLGVWQTGLPFTVVNPSNVSNTVPGLDDRVDLVGDPNLANKSTSSFFNPGAFASQAKGTLGTERINQYFGPHYRRMDIGLDKTFSVRGRLKLDFKAQSFNIFNTPSFSNPNSTLPAVTAPDTPAITLSNINDTSVNKNHFGQVTSVLAGYAPRAFQFALTLHF